jgi:hypothetical protein
MTITEFLLARIAEDEEVAHSAYGSPWRAGGNPGGHVWTANDSGDPEEGPTVYVNGGIYANQRHTAAHIARAADPARVLAECKAKREIVEWHSNFEGYDEAECCEERWGPIQLQAPEDRELSAGVTSSGGLSMRESFATQEYLGCVTLMMLASVYADHPDYQPEWGEGHRT